MIRKYYSATDKGGGEPAFPFTWVDREGFETTETGLTKRECFAAMAMLGLLTNPSNKYGIEGTVELSVKAADELLKQLSNG